jgi:membrane protein required for colicin V production
MRSMLGPLTYLDAAVLAIALISGLLAMYRGFTREILSIISWITAAAAVLYFVLYHKPTADQIAQQFNAPSAVAQVVVGGIIFLIVLIIVHLITSRLSDSILDSRVGMIDRLLGLLFGAVRGFILVVIPYMFYESFVPDRQQQYPWVRESISLPYIQSTGNTFRDVLVRIVPQTFSKPTEGTQG